MHTDSAMKKMYKQTLHCVGAEVSGEQDRDRPDVNLVEILFTVSKFRFTSGSMTLDDEPKK